ncbi:VOC family protein [Methylobacterium sp. WSM2598]|uniref:VOC family protein n=1 Tax=Methylobacterium sp. WSM2598 TaxID=398261 RepID=UPI0003663938|nr:VOC family protein [Methylobacterium sp. WSM2598]
MNHLSNWIEIPVADMARARAFYEGLLETRLVEFSCGPLTCAMVPTRDRRNRGALVQGAGYAPSSDGALIYLDAGGRLDAAARRIAPLGGTILTPRTRLSEEAGEVVIFRDPEGNRLGLHSPVAPRREGPVTDAALQGLLRGRAPGLAFLITRGPRYDDPATAPLQWEHARAMTTLLRDGPLTHVTALVDGAEVLGFGLIDVATREEAEAVLAADPGVAGGRLAVTLLTALSFTPDDVAAS